MTTTTDDQVSMQPPFSQYLIDNRIAAGLSVRAAARKAWFSEGRWRQLERGYQQTGTERVSARPRPVTVVMAADALGVDAGEALKVADFAVDVDEVRREIDLQPVALPVPSSRAVRNEVVNILTFLPDLEQGNAVEDLRARNFEEAHVRQRLADYFGWLIESDLDLEGLVNGVD